MSGGPDRPVRVLYVDDDRAHAETVAAALERHHGALVVDVEDDPRAALDAFDPETVDCVVSEYEMPGLTGLELLRAVREAAPGLPFVLFTGSGTERVAGEAVEAGVTAYLVKRARPGQHERLADRIVEAVAERRAADRESLADVVDRITRSLVGVTRPEEVYRRLCWGFATSDARLCAWVGEHDPEADRIVPRCATDCAEDLLDEVGDAMTDVATSAGRPGAEAVRTGSSQVCGRIHAGVDGSDDVDAVDTEDADDAEDAGDEGDEVDETDDADGESDDVDGMNDADEESDDVWRSAALDHGLESVAAVPLVHDGAVLGLLEVYADRPDAFDAADEARLADLGETASRALDAAGSGRTMEEAPDRLAAITAVLPDLGIIYDADGRHEEVFTGDGDLLVESPADQVGRHVHEVLPDEAADAVLETIRRTVETGSTQTVEYDVEVDGERRWFEARTAPLDPRRGADNDCAPGAGDDGSEDRPSTRDRASVLFLARDVTDRKRREAELERYETVVEALGDPVYTLDAEGRFTYVNEALEEMTGYDAEELLGEHIEVVMEERDLEPSRELIRDLLSSDDRTTATVEMDVITADGDRIRCENHIGLLPFDEAFVGTAGVLRDVTDRHRRERELRRQNDRLEEFANVVSHDLRNPLNIAQGSAELLREALSAPNSGVGNGASAGTDDGADAAGTVAGTETHLDRLERSLDRMGDIIDDVLTMARSGEAVEKPTPVDLEGLATDAWATVATGEARLVVDVPSGTTVRADESRLRTVLENLFDNAVSHGGPDVTVRVERTDAGFAVVDDGPGVPPEKRDRVFHSGVSSTSGGTGFGLSIVRQVVEAHGWSIDVTESDAGGARFEISGVRFVCPAAEPD